MKNIDNLFVRLFVISVLTFCYFLQLYNFSEPEPPVFYGSGSGSGSGSDQNVSAPQVGILSAEASRTRALYITGSRAARVRRSTD